MSRQRYQHYNVTGTGGINQQSELADPRLELADAKNVWAPNGRIETRPGYAGINTIPTNSNPSATNSVIIKYTGGSFENYVAPSGAILNDMTAGDYIYWGCDDDLRDYAGIAISAKTAPFENDNKTTAKFEYWNGSSWVHLTGTTLERGTLLAPSASSVQYIKIQSQADLTTTTVNGQTKYFVRALLGDEDTDSDTRCGVFNLVNRINGRGLFAIQFSFQKLYVYFGTRTAGSVNYYSAPSINEPFSNKKTISHDDSFTAPPSIAVVPELDEAFITYNYYTTRSTPDVIEKADVEKRDFAVGDKARYNKDYIEQLNAFPEAKYIEYFSNRLWFAGIKNDPFGIRWGAPAPFHKVLPSLSREVLMEDDNSQITAMHPLGEQMVVFKQDSIWIMVDFGLDEFDLRQYVPKRVVAGVGCVANNSVQKIRGRLIFLAEDGIYAFDGTPNIAKLSDRIQDEVNKIDVGYRVFSTSTHWKTNSLYLLGVSTDGNSYNNEILAWDYKNNSWWIWDDLRFLQFVKDEDEVDNEAIYFINDKSEIFQLGYGMNDNGAAISSYYTTLRHGRGDDNRKMLRYIELEATNKSGSSVTIEPLINDESTGTSGVTGTADFTDSNDVGHERRRQVRIGFRREFDWIQTKVSHSTKNSRFKAGKLSLAYLRRGVR